MKLHAKAVLPVVVTVAALCGSAAPTDSHPEPFSSSVQESAVSVSIEIAPPPQLSRSIAQADADGSTFSKDWFPVH